MKTWTLKFRQTDKDNFDEVKAGLKTIETRAASFKYKNIQAGDILIFACGKERLSKQVVKRQHFPSVEEMVKEIPFNKIMPGVKSVEEMKKVYSSYPDYDEKIKEFGILALELGEVQK